MADMVTEPVAERQRRYRVPAYFPYQVLHSAWQPDVGLIAVVRQDEP